MEYIITDAGIEQFKKDGRFELQHSDVILIYVPYLTAKEARQILERKQES